MSDHIDHITEGYYAEGCAYCSRDAELAIERAGLEAELAFMRRNPGVL